MATQALYAPNENADHPRNNQGSSRFRPKPPSRRRAAKAPSQVTETIPETLRLAQAIQPISGYAHILAPCPPRSSVNPWPLSDQAENSDGSKAANPASRRVRHRTDRHTAQLSDLPPSGPTMLPVLPKWSTPTPLYIVSFGLNTREICQNLGTQHTVRWRAMQAATTSSGSAAHHPVEKISTSAEPS